MTAYLIARTVKSLALLALTAGIALAVTDADAARRRRAIDRLAFPGLLGVWTTGYILAKLTSRSLGSPAIGFAMAASMLLLLLLDAGSPHRAPRATLIGTLAGATVAMHLRDIPAMLGVAAVTGMLAGGAAALRLPALLATPAEPAAVFARFRAFAVFETLTTAALFLVDMPARYGLGVALDGGIGLFGWVHGAAVLGYLAITLANHRTLGGTPRNTALQVAAGVVPFASLWVLHRTARSTSGTASST